MKQKVLLLQATISIYRVPIYKIIGESVNLTCAYFLENEYTGELPFKTVKLNYTRFNGLVFMEKGFRSFCNQFDVVIVEADLHYVSFCMLPFFKRNYKVIPWTIGIRASYKRRYDLDRPKSLVDRIYGIVLKKSDAVIFYMPGPINYWVKNGKDKSKYFVAHNTVKVTNPLAMNFIKNKILFVGTLYKEKKIYELIEAYIRARKSSDFTSYPTLDIVGKGPEYNFLSDLVNQSGYSSDIKFHGPIYDEAVLEGLFASSVVCVSPDQAGLSVLKSMGYAVPFITRQDAITGGEIFNIKNGVNGILYKDSNELVEIIMKIFSDSSYFINLGKAAKKYYDENATPEIMAKGVTDAINYVCK